MKYESKAKQLAKAAITGFVFGYALIIIRLGFQIVGLDSGKTFNGDVTLIGIPIGHLMYGAAGFEFIQRNLVEISLPYLCAIVWAMFALYRARYQPKAA